MKWKKDCSCAMCLSFLGAVSVLLAEKYGVCKYFLEEFDAKPRFFRGRGCQQRCCSIAAWKHVGPIFVWKGRVALTRDVFHVASILLAQAAKLRHTLHFYLLYICYTRPAWPYLLVVERCGLLSYSGPWCGDWHRLLPEHAGVIVWAQARIK